MALIRYNKRLIVIVIITAIIILVVATLQIEHLFWRAPSPDPLNINSTSSPNRLAQFLVDKLHKHRTQGDLDRIHFAYNGSHARKLWEKMVEYKRHIKEKGFYNRSDECNKESKAVNLWGDYQRGGLLCEVYDLDALAPSRKVIPNVIAAQVTEKQQAVTLVTHMSGDRIPTLEKIVHNWKGPISVGIYTPTVASVLVLWKQNSVLSKRMNIGVHVVVQRPDELFYPVNVLRNVALDHSVTDYVYLTDADLVPTPNMDSLVRQYLPKHSTKQAFIVPAFEIKKETSNFPQSKVDLMRKVYNGQLQPFLVTEYSYSYGPTNYTHWLSAQMPYQVSYEPGFEPYVIISKDLAPRYYEPLVGYFLNKISFILELEIAGFEFHVLPSVFTVHVPHPGRKTKGIKSHLTCVLKHFVSFLQQLESTYCVRFIPYAADLFS